MEQLLLPFILVTIDQSCCSDWKDFCHKITTDKMPINAPYFNLQIHTEMDSLQPQVKNHHECVLPSTGPLLTHLSVKLTECPTPAHAWMLTEVFLDLKNKFHLSV